MFISLVYIMVETKSVFELNKFLFNFSRARHTQSILFSFKIGTINEHIFSIQLLKMTWEPPKSLLNYFCITFILKVYIFHSNFLSQKQWSWDIWSVYCNDLQYDWQWHGAVLDDMWYLPRPVLPRYPHNCGQAKIETTPLYWKSTHNLLMWSSSFVPLLYTLKQKKNCVIHCVKICIILLLLYSY